MQVNICCVDVKRALFSTGCNLGSCCRLWVEVCEHHLHTSAPQQHFQQHTPPKPSSTTLGLLLEWHWETRRENLSNYSTPREHSGSVPEFALTVLEGTCQQVGSGPWHSFTLKAEESVFLPSFAILVLLHFSLTLVSKTDILGLTWTSKGGMYNSPY